MPMKWYTVLLFAIAANIGTALLLAQGGRGLAGPVPAVGPNPSSLPAPTATGAVLSGRFMLDDGSAPPERVRVELTCNSLPRPQGWTDAKGNFAVQLGINNPDELADLTYKSIERPGSGPAAATSAPPIDSIPRDLAGCDLRGVLPGYRSDVVSLSGHRRLDSPDVGTIVLHRLANVEGLTASATTAMAPANARKALERASEAFKKRNPDEAQKELKKAVEIYPKYALAWLDLGRVYESRNHLKEATDAYRHSVEADDKYLYPYERLYILSAREEQWPQVRELTNNVIRLDPYDFPRAYYFSALANLNLNDLDAAEKSAREAVKLDLAANPRAGYVLGVILARKQNFTEAVDLLRAYLKAVPNSIDGDMAKRQLAELEKYVAPK
jgi:tetratricopeptide (TPR) repeat protein